jgi:hypothetical protein
MTQLRARGLRVQALGGLLALTGILGLRRLSRRGRHRRPTGADLMRMNEADFSAFVAASGIETVTSAGLTPVDGSTH